MKTKTLAVLVAIPLLCLCALVTYGISTDCDDTAIYVRCE